MINYILAFFISFLSTIFLTPIIRNLSLKKRLVDRQDYRKTHKRVISRLGGIAIYLGFIAGMWSAFFLDQRPAMQEFINKFIAMLAGGTIIAVLGIYDDVKGANAWKKFSVQIIAAIILIIFDFKVAKINIPFSHIINLGFLAIPLTIIWIIGITNAINIIDGVDGLAAGVVAIVSLTLFTISFSQKNVPLAFMGITLAGATAGFLRYNFNPAKIFMGDTGSMFLGFIVAAMAIQFNLKSTVTVSLLIPIIVLGVPIIDTLAAIIRRILKGTHVFRADNGHIHHRLLILGLSQKQVVVTLYLVTILLGLLAFVCTFLRDRYAAILLVGTGIMAMVGVGKLGLIRFSTAEARILLRPTLKNIIIYTILITVIMVTVLLFKEWNTSFDSIDNILTHARKYGDRETDIIGWTSNALTFPPTGSVYKLNDGTGTIWVVSRLGNAPKRFLHIKATVKLNLDNMEKLSEKEKILLKSVSARTRGPILYETKRISIFGRRPNCQRKF